LVGRLVRSRYGFHIVAIDHRVRSRPIPFEAAHPKIVERLRQAVQGKALRQYIAILAGQSEVISVDLNATTTPLVQ
jgi:peptidyl-prolyl cis-trans isomerase C